MRAGRADAPKNEPYSNNNDYDNTRLEGSRVARVKRGLQKVCKGPCS